MWVRTKDGDAQEELDYKAIDQEVHFKKGQSEEIVSVQIVDDDGWEPDEDFYVELYDKATNLRLHGADSVTRVTILDDDKPGMLVFEEKKAIRHPANEDTCIVVINRVQGTDGDISVKYKTVQLGTENQQAKPDVDY